MEAVVSLVLMAGVPVFIKFTSATPLTIGLFRLSAATVLFTLFFSPTKSVRPFTKTMILPLFLIGLFFAIHWITYFLSIKKSTASIGLLGMSTYGIHLIFLGWAFRNHRPRVLDFVGLILALAGTFFIIPEFSIDNTVTAGILLGILSGFCFALLPVLHQQYSFIPERFRVFGQFFFAWLLFMFFIPYTEWSLQPVDWWALLYLAIPGTFIAHTLWVRVTTRLSTTISSIIFYLIIPMTMVISHFWLKEAMPFDKIIGALLIVLGNVFSISGRIKK